MTNFDSVYSKPKFRLYVAIQIPVATDCIVKLLPSVPHLRVDFTWLTGHFDTHCLALKSDSIFFV